MEIDSVIVAASRNIVISQDFMIGELFGIIFLSLPWFFIFYKSIKKKHNFWMDFII